MSVVTRFAPSPTGYLHIGSARTALFNWLFAQNQGGKFLLRIEDTDRARSTPEAIIAILEGMKWLGLDWDDEEIYQFARADRHRQVALELLEKGQAYQCYCTTEELEAMRAKAMAAKASFKYDGTWRNRSPSEAPVGVPYVIRLKAPQTGETVVEDEVQGRVVVQNDQLDDMVLLRSDSTPTYMLAVVVDDHDMGVTHVIRGDDHLTNAFRQTLLYKACGWNTPIFSHIPLIHGADGAKLSKRHGALGVEAYRDMGYLPEAMRNYLLRLGWSHGDDEIIPTAQAVEWFNLESIGKSPARFDFAKLDHINGHYIREAGNDVLLPLIEERISILINAKLDEDQSARLRLGVEGLKQRAKTLKELAENALFYVQAPHYFTDKAQEALNPEGKALLAKIVEELQSVSNWSHDNLELVFRAIAEKNGEKVGKLMAPIRAAITGSHASPSMFEVMEILGKPESLARLQLSC